MCLILSFFVSEKFAKGIFIAILMSMQISKSKAAFAEYPMNINLAYPSEMVAKFRCRHESGARVDWLINGSDAWNFVDLDVTIRRVRDNGTIVDKLSITVTPEHNGTQVACKAMINGATEMSPTATLTVITVLHPEVVTTTEVMDQRTTTSFNQITTTESTTENPTDVIGFDRAPMSQNVTVGATVQFSCQHRDGDVGWRIDGERPNSFPNVSTKSEGIVYTLTIRNTTAYYNGAEIQCVVGSFDGGRKPESTSPAILLLQGQLDAVSDLRVDRSSSTLTWVPPFSLDLTGVDPDIVYCVEVYNITCGRRDLIVSDCNVTEPSYTSDDIAPDGYIYEYTVTPKSNVEGARNGTSLTVTEEFMMLHLSSKGHKLSMMNNAQPPSEVMVTIHLDVHDDKSLENLIHAESYAILLNSMDGQSDDDGALLVPSVVMRNESLIVFRVLLLFRRLWTYTVLAHGCDEHMVMGATHLSTHDIQGISITSPHPGEIRVTGYFIQGSTATGVLIAVVTTSEIHFHLLTREMNELHLERNISNVVGGDHHVSAFVFEESVPFNRTATIPKDVSVEKGSGRPTFSIEYELNPTSAGVCVNCSFLDSNTSECAAVVHQRISQLSSSGLMNIESSHKFTRSGDTAYGCIERVDLEQYQVGVIGGITKDQTTENEVSKSSSQEWIFAVTVVISLLVVVIISITVILLFIILNKTKRREKRRQPEDTLSLPPESPLPPQEIKENEYAVVSPRAPPRESTPLLRTEADSSTAQPTQQTEESTLGPDAPDPGSNVVAPPPLPPSRIGADSSIPVYAETRVCGSQNIPVPPAADEVVYHEVKGYKNEQGHHYALLPISESAVKAPYDDPHMVVYSEINPKSQIVKEQVTSEKQSTSELAEQLEVTDAIFPTHFPLLSERFPIEASKWKLLGEALSFDDDRLDEIFTNNETDEACLQEMLEIYMARPNFKHNWEEIREAIKKIGEETSGGEKKQCIESLQGNEISRDHKENRSALDEEATISTVVVDSGEFVGAPKKNCSQESENEAVSFHSIQ